MPKLTPQQKLRKAYLRYALSVADLDKMCYGQHTGPDGSFRAYYRGYPPPAPWVRDHKRRRN